MKYFQVRNFDKYQHYKERNPPCIKVHRSIFEDYAFECLQDASKLHLMLIWVLASQCDNKIPMDVEWLKRKLGVTGKITLKPLLDGGFIEAVQGASEMLAICQQSADSEAETETYKATETYTPDACAEAFEICWDKYPRKAGNKKKALDCFKKSVWAKGDQGQETFLKKMGAYVASVDDPGFLQHGETFFRNWQDLEISNIRPIKNETWEEKHERELQEVRDRHANA